MAPRDCAKKVFGILWGLYEFLRMPFGLNGAAATFQRLMDTLLSPHISHVAAYIEDMIVFTKTWNQRV